MSQIKNQAPKTRMVDADKDGQIDSHHGVGCMVIWHIRLLWAQLRACYCSTPMHTTCIRASREERVNSHK
jgi:hypothetical protein